MAAHARRSPSAADRYFLCPGSPPADDGPRISSTFAAEGTVLHEIAANCVEHGFEPHDFVGRTMSADGYSYKIGYGDDEVDPSCMLEGLDWIRDLPGEVWVETRVALEPWQPGQFGTLDLGSNHDDLCTIADWKFGVGQPVSAVENRQLRIYALGFYQHVLRPRGIKPKRFRIVILQPRCPGGGGEWEISFDELMAFGDEAAAAFERTLDPNAPRIAGEKQCFYCPANLKNGGKGCSALDDFVLDMLSAKFDDIDENIELAEIPPTLPHLTRLTPERKVYIWRHSSMIAAWLESIHTSLINDALAGNPAPGVKLVEGRGTARYYTDEPAAEALLVGALADEAFTKKLKSPAQAEKVMKPVRGRPGYPDAWTKLEKIIDQDKGKPALTTLDDDRPALKSVDDKFDDED